MSNQNLIQILTMSEFREYIIIFGEHEEREIKKMIEIAESYDMACLGSIDLEGDTFFNELQAVTIKKEINTLSSNPNLNQKLLESLFAAADCSIKSSDYIKIKGFPEESI